MASQYSISVPDPLQELIDLIAEEKQMSKSSTVVYLIEKGMPSVIEELNKFEVYKEMVAKRKADKSKK